MKAGHLKLTGYRLPTESSGSSRAGRARLRLGTTGAAKGCCRGMGGPRKTRTSILGRWVSCGQVNVVCFDALGNAMEWVEDPAVLYVTGQKDDIENAILYH